MLARRVAALLAAVVLGAGAGWAQQGAAGHFRLEWEVGTGRRGQAVVSGYLHNDYGVPAVRVQLLVEVLDASGRTVAQAVKYIDREVPPYGRAYFEVAVPRPGAGYRVTINFFDWLVVPGG